MSEIIFEGEVRKEGHDRARRWKTRFCRLTREHLSYGSSSTKLDNRLNPVDVKEIIERDKLETKKDFGWELVVTRAKGRSYVDRVYRFAVAEEDTRKLWVVSIRKWLDGSLGKSEQQHPPQQVLGNEPTTVPATGSPFTPPPSPLETFKPQSRPIISRQGLPSPSSLLNLRPSLVDLDEHKTLVASDSVDDLSEAPTEYSTGSAQSALSELQRAKEAAQLAQKQARAKNETPKEKYDRISSIFNIDMEERFLGWNRDIGERINLEVDRPVKRDREDENEYRNLLVKVREAELAKKQELLETKNKLKYKPPEHARLIEKNIDRILKKEKDYSVYYSVPARLEYAATPTAKKNDLIDVHVVVGHRNLYFVSRDRFAFKRKLKYKDLESILQNGYNHSVLGIMNTQANDVDIVLYFQGELVEEVYRQKMEFLDYLTDAVRALHKGRKIPIFFVDDPIKYLHRVRSDLTNKKIDIKPGTIDPFDVMYINHKNDFLKIGHHNSLQLPVIKTIEALGDQAILFTTDIEKKNRKGKIQQRYFIVTDCALYLFDKLQSQYKRRIDLDMIGQIFKRAGDREQFLIQVPEEYDVLIKTKHYVAFEETMKTLFEDADLIIEFDQTISLESKASIEKSDEYKQIKKKNDLEYLMHKLREAIKEEEPRKIQLSISLIKAHPDSQNNILISNEMAPAETMLKQIKKQQMVITQFDRAIKEKDLLTAFRIVDKYGNNKETFKSLREFIAKSKSELNRILNEKVILKRIEQVIELAEKSPDISVENALLECVRIAKLAGFMGQAEQFLKKFDLIVQRQFARKHIDGNKDADSLIVLLEDAKQLSIDKEPVFQKAMQFVPNFIGQREIKKEIENAIIQGRRTGDHRLVKAVRKKYESKLADGDEWLQSYITEAIEEIKNIKLRKRKIESITRLVVKLEIELKKEGNMDLSIVEKLKRKLAKADQLKYVRENPSNVQVLSNAHNLLQSVNEKLERGKMQAAYKLRSAIRDAIDLNNIHLIKELVAEAKLLNINILDNILAEAEEILSKLEEEKNIRATLTDLLQQKDRLTYKDLDHVVSVLKKAHSFSETEPLIMELQPALHLIKEQEELRLLMIQSVQLLDEYLLEGLIEKAKKYPALAEEVKKARHAYQTRKRLEQNIRNQLKVSIKEHNVKIMQAALATAAEFPSVAPLVDLARYKLVNQDDTQFLRLQEELEKLIIKGNFLALEEFINCYEGILPAPAMKHGMHELMRLRGQEVPLSEFKKNLESLVQSITHPPEMDTPAAPSDVTSAPIITAQNLPKVNELRNALRQAQKYSSKDDSSFRGLLIRAREVLREAERQEHMVLVRGLKAEINSDMTEIDEDDEQPVTIDNSKQLIDELKRQIKSSDSSSKLQQLHTIHKPDSKLIATHPLIQRLHEYVKKLQTACEADGVNDRGRFTVEMHNPCGKNVVKVLTEILSDRTKKRFLVSERTAFDVISQITDKLVRDYVQTFKETDAIKTLLHENKSNHLSILFVHFSLSVRLERTDLFTYLLESLLANDRLLRDSYDTGAVLRDVKYRDELMMVLSLLHQFEFIFHSFSQGDVIDHPVSKLKGHVRAIVQHFVSNTELVGENLENLGDESYQLDKNRIGKLVRHRLCPTLLSLLEHGIRTSRLFGAKPHIWQMIEEIADLKRTSAFDLGGLALPGVVDHINELFNKNKQLRDAFDMKFRSFICHALNEQCLSMLLESLFNVLANGTILTKYYDVDTAILFQKFAGELVLKKVADFTKKLGRLPFSLRLNAEFF